MTGDDMKNNRKGRAMNPEQYLSNPCKASSMPFWKTNLISLPPFMSVVRDDLFPGLQEGSIDILYFKLLHRLNALLPCTLPNGFSFTSVDEHSMAAHISHCYEEERVSVEELLIRLVKRADFVTVSGRMNNPNNPYALYLNCGFETPVIWHVVRGQ